MMNSKYTPRCFRIQNWAVTLSHIKNESVFSKLLWDSLKRIALKEVEQDVNIIKGRICARLSKKDAVCSSVCSANRFRLCQGRSLKAKKRKINSPWQGAWMMSYYLVQSRVKGAGINKPPDTRVQKNLNKTVVEMSECRLWFIRWSGS